MGEFYAVSDLSRQLRDTLKPDPKTGKIAAQFTALEELRNNIDVGMRDAEKFFVRRQHAECSVHLHAAKANQVVLLGKIDDIADSDLSADRRAALRHSCLGLGAALTRMMVKADAHAMKRAAPESDSDDETSLPISPGRQGTAPDTSPVYNPKKRAPGGPDSPLQKPSSPKRQKIETPAAPATTTGSATRTTANTTNTTTTTTATATHASLPAYRPVPHLDIASGVGNAMSGTTPAGLELQSPGSPAQARSPQKSRPLSPQPRPRPASQLYKAPPDFTGQTHDRSTPRTPASAMASTPEPGKPAAGHADQHA